MERINLDYTLPKVKKIPDSNLQLFYNDIKITCGSWDIYLTVSQAKQLLRELANAIANAEENSSMAASDKSNTVLPND